MYERSQENKRIEISVKYTAKLEAQLERNLEIAKNAIKKGFDNQTIAELTDLPTEQVEQLRNQKE
jgi:hypothetical protein